jgi:hypothetical protein
VKNFSKSGLLEFGEPSATAPTLPSFTVAESRAQENNGVQIGKRAMFLVSAGGPVSVVAWLTMQTFPMGSLTLQ